MASSTPCPWQLYLFAFTHLFMAIVMMFFGFVDTGLCAIFFETGDSPSCNRMERFESLMVGICGLYIFGIFYMLTHENKAKKPELKRLAIFANYCTIATFCGIISVGSSAFRGFEQALCHKGDMLYFFALFIIFHMATADDSPMAGNSRSILTDIKCFNPKAMVLLVGVITLIKFFVLTDFMDMFSFMDMGDMEVSGLSRALEVLIQIFMFEIVLGLLYALSYGNAKDQENIVMVFIVAMIISAVSILPFSGDYKEGMVKQGIIAMVVYILLSVFAIVQGRKDAREGYETIATTV